MTTQYTTYSKNYFIWNFSHLHLSFFLLLAPTPSIALSDLISCRLVSEFIYYKSMVWGDFRKYHEHPHQNITTENSIKTCIFSYVKQITSPGWMHDTNAQGWCTGMTQRDGMGREAGGGIGMGTHVNPWPIHVNVWQKSLQYWLASN